MLGDHRIYVGDTFSNTHGYCAFAPRGVEETCNYVSYSQDYWQAKGAWILYKDFSMAHSAIPTSIVQTVAVSQMLRRTCKMKKTTFSSKRL